MMATVLIQSHLNQCHPEGKGTHVFHSNRMFHLFVILGLIYLRDVCVEIWSSI